MSVKTWICGLSFLGLLSCSQPQGYCQVAQQQGQAHFAVYEAMVPMPAGCEGEALTTERIGFETYQLPGQDEISIAWRTETLQERFDETRLEEAWEYHETQRKSLSLNVRADYSSKPDAENRCHILDNSNPAEPEKFRLSVHFEELQKEAKRLPAVTYRYEWRKMVVYSMPASPGQLVEGEVTFSSTQEGVECKGDYRFVALWPAYKCETDEDCVPSERGREGSPLNPAFAGALKCHSAGYCTLTRPPAELIGELSK